MLAVSCTSGEVKRPSPLSSDSTLIDGIKISVHYSSPGVKKRKIWGELVPYDSIWRTGADKATYLEVDGDVLINGELLKKGKYAIFTIPRADSWTIIFNKDWNQWGAYNYEQSEDVLRVDVKPRPSDYTERMSFSFEDHSIKFEWEYLYYVLDLATP